MSVRYFHRACDKLAHVTSIICSSLLVLMTVIAGWQVWTRYVWQQPATWTEQAALLLIGYYVLLAAAICVKETSHLGLTFFSDRLEGTMKTLVWSFNHVTILGFGLLLTGAGWHLAINNWGHLLPAMPLPHGLVFFPFIISGVLCVLFSIQHLLRPRLREETL